MGTLETQFADLIGSQLTAVWGEVHVEKGKPFDDSPLSLWLEFDGKKLKGFKGTPNGEGVTVVDEPPRPHDMGEAGEMIVRDLTLKSPFARAVGSSLRAVWELRTPESTSPIGFRFAFGGLIRPMILNWGDEIQVRMVLPPDAGVEVREFLFAGSDSTPK